MWTDAEMTAFVRSFENCTWPRAEWTHSRHIVMALWYLRVHTREEATRLIREGIQRYNLSQGNQTGYHETITLAWIAVIECFLREQSRHEPISALVRRLLDECGDKDYLLRFYSKERLFSEDARHRWVD